LKRTLSYSYPVAVCDSIAKNLDGRTDTEQTVPVMPILVGSVSDNDNKFLEAKDIIVTVMAQQTTVAAIPEGCIP
jgi:hypothetical protein